MVTSRQRKRWIIPKGWPEKKRSLREIAVCEALEEAGCEGIVAREPISTFDYQKLVDKGYAVTCRVFVFPLLVTVQRLRWKEKRQRRLIWLPIAEAAATVDDAGLASLLAALADDPAELGVAADIAD